MNQNEKPIIIGIGGLAMSGKDTFVKIAKKILKDNGYTSIKLAFADALKEELDPFTRKYYNISVWTNDTKEKNLVRRSMVSHGCIMRDIDPEYWIKKIDEAIETIHFVEDVIFISDCRFPNEVDWVHEKWSGWFVHLKKYLLITEYPNGEKRDENHIIKLYDKAPNEEEAVQDPLCIEKADYRLELENAIEKTYRERGIKITAEALVDDSYLINEITKCLTQCPFLKIFNKII